MSHPNSLVIESSNSVVIKSVEVLEELLLEELFMESEDTNNICKVFDKMTKKNVADLYYIYSISEKFELETVDDMNFDECILNIGVSKLEFIVPGPIRELGELLEMDVVPILGLLTASSSYFTFEKQSDVSMLTFDPGGMKLELKALFMALKFVDSVSLSSNDYSLHHVTAYMLTSSTSIKEWIREQFVKILDVYWITIRSGINELLDKFSVAYLLDWNIILGVGWTSCLKDIVYRNLLTTSGEAAKFKSLWIAFSIAIEGGSKLLLQVAKVIYFGDGNNILEVVHIDMTMAATCWLKSIRSNNRHRMAEITRLAHLLLVPTIRNWTVNFGLKCYAQGVESLYLILHVHEFEKLSTLIGGNVIKTSSSMRPRSQIHVASHKQIFRLQFGRWHWQFCGCSVQPMKLAFIHLTSNIRFYSPLRTRVFFNPGVLIHDLEYKVTWKFNPLLTRIFQSVAGKVVKGVVMFLAFCIPFELFLSYI